jgi:hypothetical protein
MCRFRKAPPGSSDPQIVASVSLWSLLGNRIGIRNALAAGCFAEAVGVVASVVHVNVWGLFLATTPLGGTLMQITALGLIAARRVSPRPRIRRRPDR